MHLISADVPLGYLLNFRRSSFVRAVDLGVRDTRAWCARHGIRTRPVPPGPDPGGTVSAGTALAGAPVTRALPQTVGRPVRRRGPLP